MSEALLDVVNEHDEVIGQAARSEIKDEGWMCRIIQVFVINDEGKVLTQWRSYRKSSGPRLFDSSVGGHVDAGESYDEAAHREMQEELGIQGELLKIGKVYDDEVSKHGTLYTIKHNGPFSNWETEADKLEWFDLEELELLTRRLPFLFTGGLKSSIKKYKKFIKNQEIK
ncbi:MAG: isopentenyldiphosphate isomerase [Alphaproteobacteria bacterium]